MAGLQNGTCLRGRREELAGRSILLITGGQLATALALMELDGVASRIVICPPDVSPEHYPNLIATGGLDAVVTDSPPPVAGLLHVPCGCEITPHSDDAAGDRETEWILLTSGTTGAPKMIAHTLASLSSPIAPAPAQGDGPVWGTFYDIRRYGGMQIFLRAVLCDGSLVLSSATEPVADHLVRLGAYGVTHLSGTPSHWRRALMSPKLRHISPAYIRLSGEIVDQSILNALRASFSDSAIGHAFASTEAGVAFDVNDGLEGFPAGFLGVRGDVEMKVVDDTLRIRSPRRASRYLGSEHGPLAGEDGFVDTGDVVREQGGRYYFLGRRNGVINVGGLKVYPEEVEAVINRHPAVRMSVVRSRKNPITGALVSADVVLKGGEPDSRDVKSEILEICRQNLAPHKIPASIRWVPALEVAAAGKLVRHHA